MIFRLLVGAIVALGFFAQAASATETPRPKNAYLYIGWPGDGEIVSEQSFRVWFGLRNMGIAPAGIKKPNTGHHHLVIDAPLPKPGQEIPSNNNYRHFGAGQSEMMLELPPGQHTLQLVLADHEHIMHNPPLVSRKVTITVR